MPRWMRRCWRRRPARPVRLQYTRDQGTGWDPKGPASIHRARAAIDAAGNVIALRFPQQGLLAPRRADEREQGGRHARRPSARRAAQGERRLRRAGRGLRVRQQARRLGDDRAAARARLAAALGAPARSGRAADPLRLGVLHGRGGGGGRRRSGRVPAQASQGAARHRGDQGGGRTRQMADAARRRAATRPATTCRAAASPIRSATARSAR